MRREWILLIVCGLLAFVLAKPYAGSWNDASRLAMAECVVDYKTWSIDHSMFVDMRTFNPSKPLPYPADRHDLLSHGTLDKLLIHGRFYSDKTPLPSLYLAGVYQLWRIAGGPSAIDRADWFCCLLTWSSSGVAFVFAVAGVLAIGRIVGLSDRWRLFLACSFAFGSILPGYVSTVNGHIIQLAAAVWIFVGLFHLPNSQHPVRWLTGMGILLGIAYAADFSAGPTLVVAISFAVLSITRKAMSVVFLALAAMPFAIAHHIVNFQIGGSLAPANANPEYFHWHGSPFLSGNITGRWRHESIVHLFIYMGDLLFGKQGFLTHNWPAFLAAFWSIPLIRQAKGQEKTILFTGLIWCLLTFVLASVSSTNRSGQCLSIRWFLPLLAVAYSHLAILVRDRQDLRPDVLVVSACGLIIGVLSTWYGLWIPKMLPGYWGIVGVSFVALIATRWIMTQSNPAVTSETIGSRVIGSIRMAILRLSQR